MGCMPEQSSTAFVISNVSERAHHAHRLTCSSAKTPLTACCSSRNPRNSCTVGLSGAAAAEAAGLADAPNPRLVSAAAEGWSDDGCLWELLPDGDKDSTSAKSSTSDANGSKQAYMSIGRRRA